MLLYSFRFRHTQVYVVLATRVINLSHPHSPFCMLVCLFVNLDGDNITDSRRGIFGELNSFLKIN